MAVRFATATGVWSNTGIWDNGAEPTSADVVYPNGFTVTIDKDISVDGLNNNISPVYLPAMPIPKMTGNTQPSGTVIAGSDTTNAWKAFDQDASTPTTFWAGTGVAAVNSTAWVGYTFTSAKTIKRYYFYRTSQNPKPISWIFEGSNDGFATAGIALETVTNNALTTSYLSGVLPNTTAYTSYRIYVTAVTSGTTSNIYQFEMTESTATTYGTITGGSFTVPSSLSGTRNIVQTGAGIVSNNNNADSQIINVNATSGATVNFNVTSGGYIFNQFWYTGSCNVNAIKINGNCIVYFNADIWGSQQTGGITNNTGGNIVVNANAIININGNIYASKGHISSIAQVINCYATTSNSAVINITGNLIGTTTAYAINAIINCASLATFNITGSLTSGLGYCFYSTVGSNLNIPTGTVAVTDLNSSPAIFMTSNASLLTINSPIINKANVNAVCAAKMRFYSTGTPYWVFQNNLNADITLAYGSAIGEFPNEADVKLGVTYAASPTRTGTCAVPLPQYVSQGVATGSTIGTAYLNAADVWNIQTSTLTTAGSIGERLKNASTVQTNGDQLASYIV